MIDLSSKTDDFIKMINLLSKTNDFIKKWWTYIVKLMILWKMINLFNKTDEFIKNNKFI